MGRVDLRHAILKADLPASLSRDGGKGVGRPHRMRSRPAANRGMTEDPFWDPLLPEVNGPAGPSSVRDAAHALLGQLRQELVGDWVAAPSGSEEAIMTRWHNRFE